MQLREFTDLIQEYDQTSVRIQRRIDQLTERIAGRAPLLPGESRKMLEERRRHLYGEYAELRLQIVDMSEYVASVRARKEAFSAYPAAAHPAQAGKTGKEDPPRRQRTPHQSACLSLLQTQHPPLRTDTAGRL